MRCIMFPKCKISKDVKHQNLSLGAFFIARVQIYLKRKEMSAKVSGCEEDIFLTLNFVNDPAN